MGSKSWIVDFFSNIDVGIFMKRTKKQKLLRKRKMILLNLLETNKRILELKGKDKLLEDEIKELEKKIFG